ncbi:MAG: hypothetical protein AAF993_08595 [Pseudomonadota bacterium]
MSKVSKARSSQRAGKRKTPRDTNAPPSAFTQGERVSQVTLQMRQSLHRELARKAFESGMTMRGFIMSALQKAGLHVTDADLIDRRRRED